MPVFPRKKTSPARDRLQSILAERAELDTKLAELRASIARLADVERAPEIASNTLARLDAEAAAEMAAFATGAGAMPEVDEQAREDAQRALSSAQAQARAAATARAGLEAQQTAAAQNIPSMVAYSNAAIADVLAEEIEPLAEEATATFAELVLKHERVVQMVDAIRDIATNLQGAPLSQASAALGAAATLMSGAFDKPRADFDALLSSRAAINAFVADLRTDSGVALGVR
jgi:hypothetical protein